MAKENTGWNIPPNTCHASSRPIMLKAPSERPKCCMRRAMSSEPNNQSAEAVQRAALESDEEVEQQIEAKQQAHKRRRSRRGPAAAGSTTCMKLTDSGERKLVQIPMWIRMAARIASGCSRPALWPATSRPPAADSVPTSADRKARGSRSHHPTARHVSIGKITMPKGSWWMCGMGSSETCPPWKAVSVASQLRGPRMTGFVARGGKQEHHVPYDTRYQLIVFT